MTSQSSGGPATSASARVARARVALDEATAARAEHRRLTSRLAALAPRLAQARAEHGRLAQAAAAEQADVDRLERMSPSRIWASMRGGLDEQRSKEEAEAQAAAYAAERARADLERLQAEADTLARDQESLARAEGAFTAALTEFSQAVANDPDAGFDTRSLADDARRRLDDMQRRREADEALAAGHHALDRLNEARMVLGSADSWSAWDTWGGGDLISSMMKHHRLDGATDKLREASAALDVFTRELGDVHVELPGVSTPMVGELARGIDIWFDNFITDLMVRDRIKAARVQLDESIRSVEQALAAVEQVRAGLQDT